jgi:hypothetical protein
VNLEEESSNTHRGLGILEIPSSIVNSFPFPSIPLILSFYYTYIHPFSIQKIYKIESSSQVVSKPFDSTMAERTRMFAATFVIEIGEMKKQVAALTASINSLLKEKCCRSNYQEKHIASMEFPRFIGKNPSTWIFKANQFFEHHKTPMEDC